MLVGLRILVCRMSFYLALGMAVAWFSLFLSGRFKESPVALHIAQVPVLHVQELNRWSPTHVDRVNAEQLAGHDQIEHHLKTLGQQRLSLTYFENKGQWDSFVSQTLSEPSVQHTVATDRRLVQIDVRAVAGENGQTTRIDFTLLGYVAPLPIQRVVQQDFANHPELQGAVSLLERDIPGNGGAEIANDDWERFIKDIIGGDAANWAFAWQDRIVVSDYSSTAGTVNAAAIHKQVLPMAILLGVGGLLAGALLSRRPIHGIPIVSYRRVAFWDSVWLVCFSGVCVSAVEQAMLRFFSIEPLLPPVLRLAGMLTLLVGIPLTGWWMTGLALASVAVDGRSIAFIRLRRRIMPWDDLEGIGLSDLAVKKGTAGRKTNGASRSQLVLRGEHKKFTIPKPRSPVHEKMLAESIVASAPRRWKNVFSDFFAKW